MPKNNPSKKTPPAPHAVIQQGVKAARLLHLDGEPSRAIVALARVFPGLRAADGVQPWDPDRLRRWASHQLRDVELAALFVLSVAEPGVDFPMHEALVEWDDYSRIAFTTWVMKPWWAWPSKLESRNRRRVISTPSHPGASVS